MKATLRTIGLFFAVTTLSLNASAQQEAITTQEFISQYETEGFKSNDAVGLCLAYQAQFSLESEFEECAQEMTEALDWFIEANIHNSGRSQDPSAELTNLLAQSVIRGVEREAKLMNAPVRDYLESQTSLELFNDQVGLVNFEAFHPIGLATLHYKTFLRLNAQFGVYEQAGLDDAAQKSAPFQGIIEKLTRMEELLQAYFGTPE